MSSSENASSQEFARIAAMQRGWATLDRRNLDIASFRARTPLRQKIIRSSQEQDVRAIENELLRRDLDEDDVRANLKFLRGSTSDRSIQVIRKLLEFRDDLSHVTRQMARAVMAYYQQTQPMNENVDTADPFRFPLDRFRTLTDDERVSLIRRAADVAKERIQREINQRDAAWIVLIGDDVADCSDDPWAIPSPKEVLRLGEPRNLVPYVFTALMIEEIAPSTSPWATTRYKGDKYPTIPIIIQKLDGSRQRVEADLDTGSSHTFIDPDLVDFACEDTWYSDRHLNQGYEHLPEDIVVAVETRDGGSHEKLHRFFCVRDWKNSPFIRVNSARRVLVGRDLLRAFSLTVELRAARSETEILTIDAPD